MVGYVMGDMADPDEWKPEEIRAVVAAMATEAGLASPDITRWGSKEWLVGIIADPTHARFYGDLNDRMPSFGKGEDGAATILTREEIDLVADWLRGDWYRPAGH